MSIVKNAMLSLMTVASIAGVVSSAAAETHKAYAGGNTKVEFVSTLAGDVSPAQWEHCIRVMESPAHCTINAQHYDGLWETQILVDGPEVAVTADIASALNTLNGSFVAPDSLTSQVWETVIIDLAEDYNTEGKSYLGSDKQDYAN